MSQKPYLLLCCKLSALCGSQLCPMPQCPHLGNGSKVIALIRCQEAMKTCLQTTVLLWWGKAWLLQSIAMRAFGKVNSLMATRCLEMLHWDCNRLHSSPQHYLIQCLCLTPVEGEGACMRARTRVVPGALFVIPAPSAHSQDDSQRQCHNCVIGLEMVSQETLEQADGNRDSWLPLPALGAGVLQAVEPPFPSVPSSGREVGLRLLGQARGGCDLVVRVPDSILPALLHDHV